MTTTSPYPDFKDVVDLARLAPSVHNTQPWLFRATGDLLILSRDSARQLPRLDPTARQQIISCGAALYLARLALRLQGFDAVVEPGSSDDERVLARIRAIPGHPVTAEEVVLAHAAQVRHTQRGAFEPRPVEPDILDEMRHAAHEQGAWIRVLSDTAEQVPLAVLLSRAERDEISDAAYRDELSNWIHRPTGARDGIPEQALPDVHRRASNLPLRDFSPGEQAAPGPGIDFDPTPPVAEHPIAIVLGTAGDGVADWLVAGQALVGLLLRGVVDGVQASPLGQVLDQPWTRRRLASELGCVGHPQMVLRIGHATAGPQTPRRPVTEVYTASNGNRSSATS